MNSGRGGRKEREADGPLTPVPCLLIPDLNGGRMT
jgi:hypothetical protein